MTQPRYHDLPPNDQGRLLKDINQDIIDNEVENMVTEITGQTLSNKVRIFKYFLDYFYASIELFYSFVMYQ